MQTVQAVERKLPSRRKRRKYKGRTLRVSCFLYDELDRLRRGKSWDALLRKVFGLPDRTGNEQPLVEGMLETMTGTFLLRIDGKDWSQLEEDAYELAIITAAKRAVKRVSKPLRMRELP